MATGYQQLVEGVQTRAELMDADDARQGAIHVIETLAASLNGPQRQQLKLAVPSTIRRAVRWDTPLAAHQQAADFVAEVARRSDLPAEQARYLVQAVLSELAYEDPTLTTALRGILPEELTVLFSTSPRTPAQRRGGVDAATSRQ